MNGEKRKYIRRRQGACQTCKMRKVRCDGEVPCSPCHRSNTVCLYVSTQNSGRSTSNQSSSPSHSTSTSSSSISNATGLLQSPTELVQSPTLGYGPSLSSPWFPKTDWPSLLWLRNPNGDDNDLYKGDFADFGLPWQDVPVPHVCDQWSSDVHLPTGGALPSQHQHSKSNETVKSTLKASFDVHRLTSFAQNIENIFGVVTPGIEFSIKSIFSNFPFSATFENEKEIIEVVNKLRYQEWALSCPVSITLSDIVYDVYTQSYIKACFDEPFGVSVYLSREFLEWTANQVLVQNSNDVPSIMLLHAVIAIGCYVVKVEQNGDIRGGLSEANARFSIAEARLHSMPRGEGSKEKFLALVTMLLFAQKCKKEMVTALLQAATRTAISLNLNNMHAIQELSVGDNKMVDLQRAFWLLYSIEKFHALRLGCYSAIDDDFLDHQPPSQVSGDANRSLQSPLLLAAFDVAPDRLLIECRFAKICHLISKQLYSPFGLQKSPEQIRRSISQLDALLQQWKDSIPFPYRPLAASISTTYPSPVCSSLPQCLPLSYHYYEALLAIHGRWRLSGQLDLTADDKISLNSSMQLCATIARGILQICNDISFHDLVSEWALAQLPLCALLILFSEFLKPENDDVKRKARPYLSIGEGFYAKLSMLGVGPYESVLHLHRTLTSL